MLSTFPQILFLAPLSATLLRIVAGLIFLYLAYYHYTNRRKVAEELSQLMGGASAITLFYCALEFAIAISLLAGARAQLAALIGAGIAIKSLLIRNSLREIKPLSQLAYALLAVICLSLLVTGPGIFSFDLPL